MIKTSHIRHRAFLIAYLAILVVVFLTNNSWRIYKDYPYQFAYGTDINQYYSYLPQSFIQKDPGFKKITKQQNERKYWVNKNSKGIALPKMTFGMSVMYLPGFLVGHAIAKNSSYQDDGYSLPYSISLLICTYLYVSIALFLLYLSLSNYVSRNMAAFSVALIFLSTNLFYYTLCEGELTHSYLFFLLSIVIFNTIKWFKTFQTKNLIVIALTIGLAVLIRPTSIIWLLFPLLFGISQASFFPHLKTYLNAYLIAVLIVVLPFFFQMIYWKIYGGTWLNWSYGDEKFHFLSPKIFDFLFSYRKGWLLYTPLMIFSVIGLFWLPKKIPSMKWSIPLILVLAIYILSSWWNWWFGGSFGSRAMVEYYALLVFPLAVFMERMVQVNYLKFVFLAIYMFTTFYNILGTHKKSWWQLHWDSMTKEAFWITFSQIDLSNENKIKYEEALCAPDDENAKKGLPERERPFE